MNAKTAGRTPALAISHSRSCPFCFYAPFSYKSSIIQSHQYLYRSLHFFPSITTFCPLGIFTVSLSPLSVSSWILNSICRLAFCSHISPLKINATMVKVCLIAELPWRPFKLKRRKEVGKKRTYYTDPSLPPSFCLAQHSVCPANQHHNLVKVFH
jgi:hypothetical protein